MPTIVQATPGESTGSIVKRFKKTITDSRLLTILRDRQYYKKPSQLKKEKLSEKRRRKKRRGRKSRARK